MSGRDTIGAMFTSAVEANGDREALVYRDSRWTYRELGARVANATYVLRSLTSAHPKRVAIIGSNHPAYVVGYFAAQVMGASTVEVGRDESLEGVRAALAESGADAIVTDRDDVLSMNEGAPAIGFDAFLDACESQPDAGGAVLASSAVAADVEACVVYTSGTTGAPKGVVLSHRNTLFVVYAVCEYLELTQSDRYAVVLPLAHTYGKSNLLTAVAAGACTVFVENPQNPAAFFGCIMRERCTVLSVVPFHLNVMARRGLPEGIDLSRLRAVTTSGGRLPADAIRAVNALVPGARLFSMYGLTESATRVTFLPPEWLHSKPGSVGRPLPGVSLETRSDDGRTVTPGSSGHVYVRGPNVMQGYLGDPGLTAATLEDGWLRTGDVGYLDADGCLFLTGREKEIIKVAGERISPTEIEGVLTAHPAVAEAAVLGMPDALLGETVWAFVILNAGAQMADIAAHCAAHLSPHKMPRRYIETTHIPRTPTGKVRRHILREQT